MPRHYVLTRQPIHTSAEPGSLAVRIDPDQRAALATDSRSYSIAIAKHGVFGDDAVGFSVSHPAAGVTEMTPVRPCPPVRVHLDADF